MSWSDRKDVNKVDIQTGKIVVIEKVRNVTVLREENKIKFKLLTNDTARGINIK